MPGKVKAVPEGYERVIPYLSIQGASLALEFYKKVFGAVEVMRMPMPDGKIGHAEIKIGNSHIMLADECPELDFRNPKALGGSPVTIMVYVDDVDATAALAVAQGGKVKRPVENQFYGDRAGSFEDPFGHTWFIATHVEDVPPDELQRRAAAAAEKNKK